MSLRICKPTRHSCPIPRITRLNATIPAAVPLIATATALPPISFLSSGFTARSALLRVVTGTVIIRTPTAATLTSAPRRPLTPCAVPVFTPDPVVPRILFPAVARYHRTIIRLLQHRAFITIPYRLHRHLTRSCLRIGVATTCASSPWRPVSNLAISVSALRTVKFVFAGADAAFITVCCGRSSGVAVTWETNSWFKNGTGI